MKSNKKIAELFEKQKTQAKRGLSAQYDNSQGCMAYYNGSPQAYQDTIQYTAASGQRQRALVNFNNVQENVDAVVGFMAQNRRQAKFIARLNSNAGQQLYSRNMNELYAYHRENENADQVESDQDLDMLVNGYGATECEVSYLMGNATRDPNGEIIKVKLDPECVYWDPAARAKNLTDSRFAGYFKDYDLKEALDLFQGSKEDDFESVDAESGSEAGYVFNPWGGLYDKIRMESSADWTDKEQDVVRVYNHQWFEYETFYRAKNPIFEAATMEEAAFYRASLEEILAKQKDEGPDGIETSDMFAFDPLADELTFDERTKRMLVEDFGELIQPVGFKRKCYYTVVISGKHVFTAFKSISQQGFSVKFKTGTWNNTNKIWVGMVNAMMEPAKYKNKALTELLFTIAANSKGGVMVEKDAVEDISDFEGKWAKTDAVIEVNSGALGQGKIQEKTRGALPTGLEGIIQLCDATIRSNGVDPSFLGEASGQESGVLFKRRIRQVISKMAKYFDSIGLYQKEDARLHADLIPVWVQNNAGQWVRITGEDGADEFIQITEDMFAPEYDVTIQEAPTSPEDKQETATILSGMADKYLSVGAVQQASALHVLALENMPLDGDDRSKVIQALQPQGEDPRIAQMQQVIDELKSQMNQVDMAKKQSETDLNIAKIDETRASTQTKAATTVRTLEDADKINVETAIMAKTKPNANTVTEAVV